jgi:tetratricopeptide (TPR) repeat protein
MSHSKSDHPNRSNSNVIHIAFGPGGGRVHVPDGTASPPAAAEFASETATAREHAPSLDRARIEPSADVYSLKEVEKLLGLPSNRLRSLDRAKIVSPSAVKSGRRAYTFPDLIALRAARELLAQDVALRDVAKAILALRKSLPKVTRPLAELRITSDGQKIVVRGKHGPFEPVSGQLLFDFDVQKLEDDVVRVLRPETADGKRRSAFELYRHASAIDDDPSRFEEAEGIYREALVLDPSLAIAWTNVGNLRFRRGDDAGAEEHYRKALTLDETQPEAHYNLGYVMLERGRYAQAVDHFQRALASDGTFSDAHFNLAMAYEALDDRGRARRHWKRYLDLEPHGTWSEIAREHL